ncbi:MAG: adenosylcobinamide-GDP ribazoletransferase [Microscillaceae bacterium]|nr:adenosylcobinamide-GDP ribazoletransferase [Microscillaceae bacterium]
MREEIRIFFTALMFYTRIPCPVWVDHSPEYINKATRYFPLIGWIVGGASALVFLGAAFLWNTPIGLVIAMGASVWITGAFHEDGFADVCDGFGGGWTKERILEIMKDSRLGAYGTVGLFFIFILKFFLLLQILTDFSQQPFLILIIFISAHSLSRFVAATFIFSHPYARDDAQSKIKPVAVKPAILNLWIAAFGAAVPLLALAWWMQSVWVLGLLFPVYGIKMYLAAYFTKKIGGYTGDCLGATQQMCEVVFYMNLMLLCKFT